MQREIFRGYIKNSDAETLGKLVNDVLTLFQVKDRNGEKAAMMDTWLLFIMDYKLTTTEIYHAHKMAIQRTLLDQNGNEIECLPMLSTNTTGKILKAYERHKQNDKMLEEGREKLKLILNPPPERTEEEKKAERKKNWETLVEAVKAGNKCEHAFLFYEYAVKKGGFAAFIADEQAQKTAIKNKMGELLFREKLKGKSIMFNTFELKKLSDYFEDRKQPMTDEVAHAFDRLQAMAITHVKNDKVCEWVKEQLSKK